MCETTMEYSHQLFSADGNTVFKICVSLLEVSRSLWVKSIDRKPIDRTKLVEVYDMEDKGHLGARY